MSNGKENGTMRRLLIGAVIALCAVGGPALALAGGENGNPPSTTTCGPASDQYGCTTTTQTTTTPPETTTPPGTPCPITPLNPTGAIPDPGGGQNGQPGNDICKPDEPPVTTTPPDTTPPPTQPPPITEPPVTTVEEPPVTTTVSDNPPTVIAEPTPDKAPGVKVHADVCEAPAYMKQGECVRDFKGKPHPISRGSG